MARIYINIEIHKREFNGRFLLALAAAERGHTVLLGHLKPLLRDGLLAPGIFLDKSLTPRPEKAAMLKDLKRRGFVLTSIDEEHGILESDYAPFAGKRYSDETLGLADAVFFWGPHDFAYMKEAFPARASRFHNTGNPRVDMWRPDLAGVFRDARPHPKPYLLLASNLASIFSTESFDTHIERHRRMGYIDAARAVDPFEESLYRFWREGVEMGWEFINAFRRLAVRFPGADFIVRPHPVESPAVWRKLLQPKGNLLVNAEGSISPWIRHAGGVVNHGCTSALETALAGTPIISYDPIPDSSSSLTFPKLLGRPARSYDELESMVGAILEGRHDSTSASDLEVLGTRLSSLSGPLAADRIADVWDGFVDPALSKGPIWAAGTAARLRRLPHLLDTYRLGAAAGFKRKSLVPSKFPPFDLPTVLAAKSTLGRALGRFEHVPVRLLGPRLLQLG